MTVLLALVAASLAGCGTYLVLGRTLSRVVIGIGLLGHAANLALVLAGGAAGDPAFIGGDPDQFADPLPQAMVLTAIVIGFGAITFLLTMAHRSHQVGDGDEVEHR